MTPERQRAWAEGIVARVPRLFDSIRRGHFRSLFILGVSRVNQPEKPATTNLRLRRAAAA